MSQSEMDLLVDFIARELLDEVRKQCAKTADVNDPKVVRGIVKAWLDGQNLKKRLWERVKHHTRSRPTTG